MSITTQIDYVVTGLQNLTTAVSKLGEISSAQLALQKSTNDLTRSMSTAVETGFASMSAAISKLTSVQEINTATTKAQAAGITKIAVEWKTAGTVLSELTAKVAAQEVAATKNLASLTSLTVQTNKYVAGLREQTVARDAAVAATSQLASQYGKLASLEGELINFQSGATAAMNKRLASVEALTAADRMYATGLKSMAAAQAAYAAESLTSVAAAQKLIGVKTTEIGFSQKLQAQLAEEAAMQKLASDAKASYAAQAMTGVAAAEKLIGAQTTQLGFSKQLQAQMEAEAKNVKNLSTETGLLSTLKQKLTSVSDDLKNSQTALGSAFRGVGAATNNLALTYGQLIPMITAYVTAATSIKAINLGADFEYQVQYITSVQNELGKISFDEIKEGLLSLGDLAHTPTELADALTVFVKAGIPAKAALSEMSNLSKFAIVTQEDLAKSAELVASQWNAWGPSSAAAARGIDSMSESMNVMASLTIISQSDIEQIQTAMKYLNMMAVTSDATYVEIMALSGAMANMGITGSMSATSIRNALINLGKDYKGLVDSFNSMGVTSFIPYGKSDIEILENFISSLSELSVQQRRTFADSELGKRALAVLGLQLNENKKSADGMSMSYAEMRDYMQIVADEGTYLGAKFEELSGTTQVALLRMGNAWEAALIESFDSKVVTAAINDITEALKGDALKGAIESLVGITTTLISAFGDLANSGAADFFSSVADGVGLLVRALAEIPGWVYASGGILLAIFGSGATATAAAGAVMLSAAGYVANFTGSLRLAEEGVISMDTALNATNAERAALIKAYEGMGTAAEESKKKIDALNLAITNKALVEALTKLDDLAMNSQNVDQTPSNQAEAVALDTYNKQTEALQEQVSTLLSRKSTLESSIAVVDKSTAANEKKTTSTRALSEVEKIAAESQQRLSSGNAKQTTEVEKLTLAMDQQYEASAAVIRAEANNTISSGEANAALKTLYDSIYTTTKAKSDMTAAIEKDKSAMEGAKKPTDDLAKATENLGRIAADALPDGMTKDLAEWANSYKKAVDDVNSASNLTKETQTQMLRDLAAEYKTGGDNIKSSWADKYQQSVDEIKNALDKLSGKDASLSKLDAGIIKISEDFDKLGVTAAAKLRDISKEAGMTPELKKTKAELEAIIAKMPELEKAAKDAFEAKLITDFEKELSSLNESFSDEHLSAYDSALKGINDKYDDMIEKAEENWKVAKEGTEGETKATATLKTEMDKVNAAREVAIAQSDELRLASNNIWDGFIVGIKDAQKEMKSLGELGAEIATELRDGFKEVFVDVIKGDIENIEGTIKEALSGIGDTVIDYIAEGLANKTMDALVEGLSSFAPEISGLLEGFTERGSASNPSYVYVTNMPAGGLGTSWDSASASALSSGVGTAASWYAGTQAAANGVNSGTSLALIEGTYQIAAGKAAATWVDTFSAGVKTAAGYAGTALGAYGVYSGIKQMQEGNVASGAVQTGISAYGTYQSAITAGIIKEGAATRAVESIAGYFAKKEAAEVAGAKVVETAASKGVSSGAGIGAGAGWAAALPAIAYALNNIGGETPTVSPSDSMNALGMTPDDLAEFSAGWKNISNSVLDLDSSLEQFGFGMQTIGEATYSAQDSMLYYTSGLGVMASAFDASTQTWSEAAVGMKLDATQLGASATAASSATVSAAAAIMSSYTGTSTSMSDAATIANAAANAYQDLAVSESGSTTYAIELQRTLEAMGLSSSQAAAAAQDLISQLESEANASSSVSEVAAGASSSLGGFATAITESAASAATAAASVSTSMSSLTSTLGGFATAAGSTADSLRKAVGSWDEAVSSGGSRAMGGPIGKVEGFANGGLLKGGSGTRDDLYLGTIGGTRYMAMGGEMVMNRRATRENYATLDAMNKGTSPSSAPQVIHNHFYVDGKEIATTIMPAVDKQVTAQARRGALTKRTAY